MSRTLLLYSLYLLLFTLFSCQPKADYVTVEDPMKGFSVSLNDSVRGATSVKELACYYYAALRGDIKLNDITRFFPDSSGIAAMYTLTGTFAPTGSEIKLTADTTISVLQRQFLETKSRAAVMHSSWAELKLIKVMIIEMEGQKLPSKKIILEAGEGKTILRASAQCVQIGDRWFLGEDIRFGV